MPLFLDLRKASGQRQDASWQMGGALLGEYSMQSFGESPKEDVESHLSQILEDNPHPKYCLSAKACQGILNRANRRGRVLPQILKEALEQVIARDQASRSKSEEEKPVAENCDHLIFEPGSCTLVGGHIWKDGKVPSLRADPGDNRPAIVLENHPADSRVKIAEDGIVQTLNARMGTGGGNVPIVVVSLDRASYNQGKNAQFDIGISEDGVAHTCIAKGPGVVAYAVDCRNASVNTDTNGTLQAKESGGTSYNLNNVVITTDFVSYWDGSQTCGTLTANNAGGNQRMPDKDNFNCVVQAVYCRYIVRRLTPLECERLQGYPDRWTDIGKYTNSNGKKRNSSDASRYKALGNSIALPSWKWVLKRICAYYERDATMASLFDGIGGFPYIWEQINGKGSCLCASEIEEFPIAVTKERIG